MGSERSSNKLAVDFQLRVLLAAIVGGGFGLVVGEEVALGIGGARVLADLERRGLILTDHVAVVFTIVASDLLHRNKQC